ncbi:MAG TPA: ATP-dependent metallopeptidase FtsH/Yme1/Tma family protein [Sediminispirochaeta sp.]|nr:ATP-dependent metallopeptidase FtsH/Yme1/Tma family protein [Sediminispirochaeta sp.]
MPQGGFNFSRFTWLIVIFLLMLPFFNIFMAQQSTNVISYSQFKQLLRSGDVAKVEMERDLIEGTLKSQTNVSGSAIVQFVTYLPSTGDDELLPLIEEHNVTFITRSANQQGFWEIFANILPLLLFVWLGVMMWRSMRSRGQGMFSVGENKAKLYDKTKVKISFDDVAGLDSAKEEIKDIVDYLKSPEKYKKLGARPSRGILLVGPPGTGKTLIARAVAGEADVPFYSTSGSDFMEMFVGVGASRVRNMFNDAKKSAPSIIFIDELDSIGRHRGAGLGGGHDEREQTLNQLLSEMDGFEQNESTIVIAATNRPDILDPALRRPGRFDREITVNLPSLADREFILKLHASKKPMSESVDIGKIARGTPGFSGADLENLLNIAAQIAARRSKDSIEEQEIEDARDTVMMGLKRTGISLTDDEKKLIAYHEAGHTLVAHELPHSDPIHKVTIIPRGMAMGVTMQLPEEDRYVYRREQLEDRLSVLLGGRVAEDLVFQTRTTGAENDLDQASKLARKMITAWGMSEKLGHTHLQDEKGNIFLGEELSRGKQYSEETAREVDIEIKTLIDRSFERAIKLVKEKRKALDDLAQALIEREEINGQEVDDIIAAAATGA